MATKPTLPDIGNDPVTGANITKEPLNEALGLVNDFAEEVSSELNLHKSSSSAHTNSAIINASTVVGVKTSDALNTLKASVDAHISAIVAHEANTIKVTSTNPSLPINVLLALQSLQEQISSLIVESGTSDAEVINARTSVLYGTFTSLKERLDSHESSPTPHLLVDVTTNTTYKYGLQQQNGFVQFIYEEVI